MDRSNFHKYKTANYLENIHLKNENSEKKLIISLINPNNEEQKNFVSNISLGLKICFFLLAIISLVKIGYISKFRITRLREIQSSYLHEKKRYVYLTNRFEDLFTFGGQQRFMKDQDQIISRDILRVIWR